MKKLLFTFLFVLLILSAIFFPDVTISASKSGLVLWFEQILPSLLPFTVLSAILLQSGYIDSFPSKYAARFSMGFTLLCGFFFGFPIGAKLASDFYAKEFLSKKQALILAVLTNNFSILYTCGYVLPLLDPNTNLKSITCFLLYGIPFLLSLILLLLLPKTDTADIHKKTASRFHLNMQIIDAGIISGFQTLIKICGYMVLFSILTKMIENIRNSDSVLQLFLLGNMEISNGIALLSENNLLSPQNKYVLAIQFLSFGGVSGFFQTASFLKAQNLPVQYYLFGKILISGLLCLLTVCLNGYYG